jgi:hypothetical protein
LPETVSDVGIAAPRVEIIRPEFSGGVEEGSSEIDVLPRHAARLRSTISIRQRPDSGNALAQQTCGPPR